MILLPTRCALDRVLYREGYAPVYSLGERATVYRRGWDAAEVVLSDGEPDPYAVHAVAVALGWPVTQLLDRCSSGH